MLLAIDRRTRSCHTNRQQRQGPRCARRPPPCAGGSVHLMPRWRWRFTLPDSHFSFGYKTRGVGHVPLLYKLAE
eukprot:2450212-Prymnesium_polylepis.1